MKQTKQKRIDLRITPEQHEKLTALAKKENRNITNYLRHKILELIKEK